ncbi:MAG: hypothetical protein GF383_07275 [Candidatus Lokiarchaeota archaeon]|nr:hypothetical protein [Candidatus Lokiarchaeota archaeon]MBD3339969.1 hypothetical protein [Candidatus Lokiarchaeota archaeon]
MSKDALLFFQAYLKEMISLGGENLPKTISSTLGAKLAKIYKAKGVATIEEGLKKMYEVINGKSKIRKISDTQYEVNTEYENNFCPVGGKFNPEIEEVVHKSICEPYTQGFLNQFDPSYTYKGEIKECILSSDNSHCIYDFIMNKKED